MAWKIFSIGKANEEITRLETELAAQGKRITELQGELKAATENDGACAAAATELNEKLEAANEKIKGLEAERDQLKKDVEAAKSSADSLAGKKALEIAALQGIKPLPTGAPGDATGAPAAGSADYWEKKLAGISNPTERTLFFRKHEKEIVAARKAQRHAA